MSETLEPATIEIAGIRAYGKHGVLPHEQQHVQAFDLHVRLEAEVAPSYASDDVADTIDYARLHARVVRLVSERSFRLLERLGSAILDDLMVDARVKSAQVTIGKPKLLSGATPSVTLSRRRG